MSRGRSVLVVAAALAFLPTFTWHFVSRTPYFEQSTAGADAVPGGAASPAPSSKGPFHFRDAFLLEQRLKDSAKYFRDTPPGNLLGPLASPPAPMVPVQSDPMLYRSLRWTGELAAIDGDRRAGAFDRAEPEYLDLLAKLREAQGPDAEAVVMLLDRIGEFYLGARDLDRGRQFFSEALAHRRTGVERRKGALAAAHADTSKIDMPLLGARLHLADLLTRIGQIDMARTNLQAAQAELAEANAIGNESPPYRRFVASLYPTYFLSLLFEQQGRWPDAEKVWREAVQGRSNMTHFAPYWTALKEQAAFYARRGDFHQAAAIAARVLAHNAPVAPELPMPYDFDARPRIDNPNQPEYSLYKQESDIAMSEIVAVDKWQTDGPDAAAPLLADPVRPFAPWFDDGSDSERAELFAWLARRIFLHMSILLDGQPAQDRATKAYTLLGEIKGRYLATTGELMRALESQRGTPNDRMSLDLLDKLAQERARQAHLYLSSVLDGAAIDERAYATGEEHDQAYEELLLAMEHTHSVFSLANLTGSLPPDAALVDTVVWDRMDRAPFAAPHRDYGAFVLRPGRGLQYVRIGDAGKIDTDVAALTGGVIGGQTRGIHLTSQAPAPEVAGALQRLRQDVFAPLEPALAGAKSLSLVADGKLALVPFGALLDGGGHPLLERYTVSYLSSWRDLDGGVVYGHGPTSGPVIVGNPAFDAVLPGPPVRASAPRTIHFEALPQAEDEANAIATTLGIPPDRRLLGTNAREEMLRAVIGPEVLHLATHSVPYLPARTRTAPAPALFEFPSPSDVENPFLRSFIALAGANRTQGGPEDGLLTGLEVASLHLNGTKLVVLSSCESAQGVGVDGQGVLGLRAAFSIAGAQAVVMNLWPVGDDASRRFMELFYSHRAAGPAEALRVAQLEMRQNPQFKDPFFWAGYLVSSSHMASPPATNAATSVVAPPAPSATPPPRPASSAPVETLQTPACFQMSTRSDHQPMHSFWSAIRAKWGGSVVQRERSPNRAVYEVVPPAGDLEYASSIVAPNGQALPSPDTHSVGTYDCNYTGEGPDCRTVTITVQREAAASSVRIDGGKPVRFSILLRGGPSLFPTVDLPATLPPAAAYRDAFAQQGNDKQPIDQVSLCTP